MKEKELIQVANMLTTVKGAPECLYHNPFDNFTPPKPYTYGPQPTTVEQFRQLVYVGGQGNN